MLLLDWISFLLTLYLPFCFDERGRYSYDQSLVHTVVLSSEHDMASGSRQHAWLQKDLAAVNRTITPWIVVEMHRPMYREYPLLSSGSFALSLSLTSSTLIVSFRMTSTDSEIFDKTKWQAPTILEGMQEQIEDLLHSHRVDLVLSGHYHSYFRSCSGLYSYRCDNGGPTYVTVGTGGAPLDGSAQSSVMVNHYTEALDKTRFGVGRASVFNATHLHWEFVAVGGNVTDEVWLRKQ